MTASSEHLDLAADFPPASRDQWRELVAGVLRKAGRIASDSEADPEAILRTPTYDGVDIRPLYTAADAPSAALGLPGAGSFVRGGTEHDDSLGWDVRAQHGLPDAEATNQAILTDLENGVTSIWLRLGEGAIAVPDLAAALEGVYLDLAPVVLDAGVATEAAARAFLDLLAAGAVPAGEVRGSLGGDPIGHAARTGTEAYLPLALTLAQLARPYPQLQALTVDGTVYHNAGAGDADEIALLTSAGVAYLRVLTEAGWQIEDALARIEFRLAVTDVQFTSIAKLRAARRVWARVADLCGAAEHARGQRQHAVSSAAMLTRRDPAVNMLRGTLACFAGAVGGAQAITVAPYDSALGQPDALALRIARNTQSVLHDESSLGRVADPAGGSWYVESLTDELAQAAWSRFTALESQGGALNAEAVEALIAPTRAARAAAIATRKDPITGVSEFPLLSETLPVRAPAAPVPTGGLPVLRYSQAFEALRDRSDEALAATGARPKVLVVALGPVAAHSARLGFAANLFAAGGLEGVEHKGVDGLAQAAAGFTVACLCSSDKVYGALAADAAQVLKDAGVGQVWLAGKPGDRVEPAVDGYVFAGVDALAALELSMQIALDAWAPTEGSVQ